MGARGTWEISAPPSQLCCEPKTALKGSLLRKCCIAFSGVVLAVTQHHFCYSHSPPRFKGEGMWILPFDSKCAKVTS